jgi:hypothetical protein
MNELNGLGFRVFGFGIPTREEVTGAWRSWRGQYAGGDSVFDRMRAEREAEAYRARVTRILAMQSDPHVEALRRARYRRLEEARARKQAEIDAALERGEDMLFWARRRAAIRAEEAETRRRTALARRAAAAEHSGHAERVRRMYSGSLLPESLSLHRPPPVESVIPELSPTRSSRAPSYLRAPGAETAAALAPFFLQTGSRFPVTQTLEAFPSSQIRRAATRPTSAPLPGYSRSPGSQTVLH